MQKQKSFTLIEMLIVVVIIGILAAALIPRLQNAQQRTRDMTRKKDLHDIMNALELYFQDNNYYPVAINGAGEAYLGTCCFGCGGCYIYSRHNTGTRLPGLEPYISQIPKDPLNTHKTPDGPYTSPFYDNNYVYSYGNVCKSEVNTYCEGKPFYNLWGQLENHNDPDRNELKNYTRTAKKMSLPYPPYSKWLYSPTGK